MQDFDSDALVHSVGADRELARDVCRVFAEQASAMLDSIRTAVRNDDTSAVQCAAHSLKGAAASIHAEVIRNLAGELEWMGRISDLSAAKAKLAEIEAAMRRVESAISNFASRYEL